MGLACKADRDALAALCEVWCIWREAVDHVRDHGATQEAKNTWEAQSPWVSILATASKQLLSLLAEFGCTPRSRSSMGLLTPGKTAKGDQTIEEKFFGKKPIRFPGA
jgi:P27 family predicted phage terminase small subunit